MWFQLVLLINLSLARSYKILALFPYPGKSHVDVFLPLTRALASRGHEVTVLSNFPLRSPIANYTDVDLANAMAPMVEIYNVPEHHLPMTKKWLQIQILHEIGRETCQMTYESAPFRTFLKANQTFDLVLAEFFNSDCLMGVVRKFDAPLVGISSSSIMHWMNRRFANPTNPAYIPNNLLHRTHRMTFLERLENFLFGIVQDEYFARVMAKDDDIISRTHLGESEPSVRALAERSSLFLVNTHFTLSFARPLVPAVVEVGGIHIEKVKQLPANLERWINDSAHGVIYFSLGSMIKGHTFPAEKRDAFLGAFGRLPQRVLWKWENETMPGKPDNVMIQKWMPQLDILCHPNVKAFISHGGLLGTTEAVHCGVPVVVMPQYGDQFTNARALEANGGGVILHLHEATEEKVYDALRTVLDPEFKKQAEELSARFRDRPLPPLETAVYWVEYVARHRGAHHMRTAAVGMPLYKYLLLDVIAFLLLVFGLISAFFFCVTRAILRKLFTRKPKQKTN